MYKRFLNDNDYLSVITKEGLDQLIRGNRERFSQAEECAEISIVEHLSENYEIERELGVGKYIAPYERCITYPVGAHVYFEDKICKVIRSISGYRSPSVEEYWQEVIVTEVEQLGMNRYSQFGSYFKGDKVVYQDGVYECLAANGFRFSNIQIPMVKGWMEYPVREWVPVHYDLWEVVRYEHSFYTLISLDDYDNMVNPYDSDNWGAIADYDPDYNGYELSEYEYVVDGGKVFYPCMDVNADVPVMGQHLSPHDPRNYNLKKHMVRLAIYELTKTIAPNNVSVVRVRDYEDSMRWLYDVSRLKINPQIPRKLAQDNKPVMDWQLATFQTEYDPWKNPWMV